MQPAAVADTPARFLKMPMSWLIGVNLLGGDDHVDWGAEMPQRALEQVVVHIRENTKRIARRRHLVERRIGIGERRPIGQAGGEFLRRIAVYDLLNVFGDSLRGFGEHRAVGPKRGGLYLRFDFVINAEHALALDLDPGGLCRCLEGIANTALP